MRCYEVALPLVSEECHAVCQAIDEGVGVVDWWKVQQKSARRPKQWVRKKPRERTNLFHKMAEAEVEAIFGRKPKTTSHGKKFKRRRENAEVDDTHDDNDLKPQH